MTNTDTATLDRIAGILTIISSGCGICGGIAAIGIGSVIGVAGVAGKAGPDGALPAAAVGGVAAVIGFVLIAISAINIAGGIGVLQGKKWGFILTAILTGIAAFFSAGNRSGGYAVVDVALCVFCVLRLIGQIGTPPQ